MVEVIETQNISASLHEVTMVVLLGMSAHVLRNFLYPLCGCLYKTRARYMLDFSLISLFTLFSVTLLSEHLLLTFTAVYTCASLAALISIIHNVNYFPGLKNFFLSPFPSTFPFLTNFRTHINLISCICILAVDFPALFPHKYAKSRNYGTGLMDVGVGLFIVAHGVTSRYARRDPPNISGWREYWKHIYLEARANVPVFFLGVIRLSLLTILHKSQPVYEYGTHWNFFFTIGCVKFLSAVILPLLPDRISVSSSVTASLICLLYQYWLVQYGLREFILQAPRSGLYSSNREGIYSCIGFTALYLYSVSLGALIFSVKGNVWEWTGFCTALSSLSLVSWGLLYVTSEHIEPISRRLTNLPYVLWIFSLVLLAVSLFIILDLITLSIAFMQENHKRMESSADQPSTSSTQQVSILMEDTTSDSLPILPNRDYFVSHLVQAIDYNQMVYFLLANILTGLINIVVETESVNRSTALCYLIGYHVVLDYFITVLYRKKIKIKF